MAHQSEAPPSLSDASHDTTHASCAPACSGRVPVIHRSFSLAGPCLLAPPRGAAPDPPPLLPPPRRYRPFLKAITGAARQSFSPHRLHPIIKHVKAPISRPVTTVHSGRQKAVSAAKIGAATIVFPLPSVSSIVPPFPYIWTTPHLLFIPRCSRASTSPPLTTGAPPPS
jgi:hypothetical protein